jgi:IS605 OrfB family transposase
VKRLQGYQFKLEPKSKYLAHLNQALGANRFVWNKLLAMNLARLANKQPILWYYEMCWFITLWKQSEEYAFLREAPSQSLQQTAKALARAFKDAFDKTQPNKHIPVFKKAGKNEAGIRYPQGFALDEPNQVVQLPKLGWVKYRRSRHITGTVKNVTVSRTAGHYTLSIQTEREVEPPVHPAQSAVGIDLGVKNFAALSDGKFIAGPNSFKRHQQPLAKLQRQLARKQKFSANWQKQRAKITRLQAHIAAARLDFLHKTSTRLSKSHAMIAVEDLKVANMTQSSKGTREAPGQQVRQKSGLNRAILDQGWGEFRRQLEYKQHWQGGWMVAVPPQGTSQHCPDCKQSSRANRQTQATFVCVNCGYADHADTVGAINVLDRAIALLSWKPKQKPQDFAGFVCEVNGAVSAVSCRNQLSAVF